MLYVGLAFSASMLKHPCDIRHTLPSMEQVKDSLAKGYSSCCNPSHKASLDALRNRYGVEVTIPPSAPKVVLKSGDSFVVLQIDGLPRETREFTKEEVDKASFEAKLYEIL